MFKHLKWYVWNALIFTLQVGLVAGWHYWGIDDGVATIGCLLLCGGYKPPPTCTCDDELDEEDEEQETEN